MDESPSLSERFFVFAWYFTVVLCVGGILTFIALHLLQAMVPLRFPIPDWPLLGGVLFAPLGFFLCLLPTISGTSHLVRAFQLAMRGVETSGEWTEWWDHDTATVMRGGEFKTPDGVFHHIEHRWDKRKTNRVRIRYDPRNPSNAVVIREPHPRLHPIRVLFSSCGCLLVLLVFLGLALGCLAWFFAIFFVPASFHPALAPQDP